MPVVSTVMKAFSRGGSLNPAHRPRLSLAPIIMDLCSIIVVCWCCCCASSVVIVSAQMTGPKPEDIGHLRRRFNSTVVDHGHGPKNENISASAASPRLLRQQQQEERVHRIEPLAVLTGGVSLIDVAWSVLWGTDGELWDNPGNSLLRDFTDVGYKLGNEPLPDWPVWNQTVLDYGAVPDDDLSDVQAFKDAIEDCPSSHALWVPNGRYIIDGPIVVTRSHMALRGETRDGTILFFPKDMGEVEGTDRSASTFITVQDSQEIGIENLSLVLRDERKATGFWRDYTRTKMQDEHWYHTGERPIKFLAGTDCWVRNVYIKNADTGITITKSNQMSIIDVVLDNFLFRKGLNHNTDGHIGLALGWGSKHCLIHNVLLTGNYDHDISPLGVRNNVFSRIKGFNLKLDHHAMGNSFNLFTEIDTGIGGRGYGEAQNNYEETYWNIKGIKKAKYLPTSSRCTFVGINTDQNTSIGPDWHHETIDPVALIPANMYLAQMAKQPSKWIPPDVELTLPPPASNQIFRLLPVHNANTNRWKDDLNQRFRKDFIIDSSAREGFMKFDMIGLEFPESTVARALLRLYVARVHDNFNLFVSRVEDDFWSEATLTYNDKPVADSVLTTLRLLSDNAPGWVAVDLTDHVNDVLSGDRVMSLKLDGIDRSNKDKSMVVNVNGGGNPSHLVIFLDESLVAAPASPSGLTATAGAGHISLQWKANTESDLASYNVYRSVDPDGYKLQAMGLTTTGYTDFVNLEAGKTYSYKVTAVDLAGIESVQSEAVASTACQNTDCGDGSPSSVGPNPDGWCDGGTFQGQFCCGACDGMCGGIGCDSFTGGRDECCTGTFDRLCSDKQKIACIIPETDAPDTDSTNGDGSDANETDPDPSFQGPNSAGWCRDGTFRNQFCCGQCDGLCGGAGCDTRSGAGSECCTDWFERMCLDENDIACIMPERSPQLSIPTNSPTEEQSFAPTANSPTDTASSTPSTLATDRPSPAPTTDSPINHVPLPVPARNPPLVVVVFVLGGVLLVGMIVSAAVVNSLNEESKTPRVTVRQLVG